jgi:mannose-6-phosphate isomerase class I
LCSLSHLFLTEQALVALALAIQVHPKIQNSNSPHQQQCCRSIRNRAREPSIFTAFLGFKPST